LGAGTDTVPAPNRFGRFKKKGDTTVFPNYCHRVPRDSNTKYSEKLLGNRRMKTLRDIPLREVPVVEPQTTLAEVIQLMEAEPLRTVVLVGDEMYMGVFNQAALESNLIPEDADLSLLTVGPYVHPVRVVAEVEEPVEMVLAQMIRRNQWVAPVLDNRTFLGVVVQDDLRTTG
jgi:CBS domain-containing protein